MFESIVLFLVLVGPSVQGSLVTGANKPKFHPMGLMGLGRDDTGTQGGTSQSVRCYSGPNQSGQQIEINQQNIEDLSTLNFDNVAASCCFNGVWLMYDDKTYNQGHFDSTAFSGWGEEFCTTFGTTFAGLASSVRYSGAPDGYKFDVLTLYESNYFMGKEQYFYDDVTQFDFDNFGESAIVNGCSSWTLYAEKNFQGDSICIYPGDQSNCYPGFFANPTDLGSLGNRVSSAKRGCYATEKLIPAGI